MAGIRASIAIGVLAWPWLLGVVHAQGGISIDKISFKVANAFEARAEVSGELRIPQSKRERLPAVLILHSSPGFDGRGAFYAEALNRAGFATIEIDYMQGRGMPATPRHHLPHVYQTLQTLAAHPRIEPSRIGIMGFSWGGILAVLTSSEELTLQHTGGKLLFAAHLGLYPICWRHRALLAGTSSWSKSLQPAIYRHVTGRPVKILAGDKDDFDDPDSCEKFLAELPAQVRPHFSLTVYPGATFAWDSRFSSTTYDIGAKKGKGGIVNVVADVAIANRSRELVVAYFRAALRP